MFEKYLKVHPVVKTWVRYAKFEWAAGNRPLSRRVYERAVEELGEDGETEELFIKVRLRVSYRYIDGLGELRGAIVDRETALG